jgi:hypothetical protein
MQVPLLLAGPILRRVEPTLVSVWLALSEAATVRITLWDGRVAAGSGNPWFTSAPAGTATLRVGPKLHVVVATLKIPSTSPRVLQPGRVYSYDCEIVTANGPRTLKSLGLLNTGEPSGKRIEALGFDENFLPSFALPPADLTQLRIVFGSCRRPANSHIDAMMLIDDLMRDNADYDHHNALKRPHQLHLGGDQIYADDVSPVHLHHLIDLGRDLLGARTGSGVAVEELLVKQTRTKKVPAPQGFADYDDTNTPGALPADHAYFPAGRRFLATTVDAQMTTVDAQSHLFSLGEFCAMYLSVWSNAVWPALMSPSPGAPPQMPLPTDADIATPRWPDRIATMVDAPLDADEHRHETDPLGAESPFGQYTPYKKAAEGEYGTLAKALDTHRKALRDFERGLAKVRRVLANIPTYMVFDDHDVTDDWNLNPMWIDRVWTRELGVNVIRNALVSYALFQDWGNDPLAYENPLTDKARLLGHIAALFPPGAQQGPAAAPAIAIDALLGIVPPGPVKDPDGTYAETRPPLKWHYGFTGPGFVVAGLDNRTRRSFVSRSGPPGNVAISALADQIPAAPLPGNAEVLIVIAPLQVIGPPLLDELVAPASYRAFDMASYTFENKAREGLRGGSRGMAGTNPDAIEGWAFDAKTFEALLARLAPHRRVVLLSGDVHYSASNVMSYWTGGQADPARFAQFTSSGMKNVMPWYIGTVDRALAPAQQLVRAKVGTERLAWKQEQPGVIVLPEGGTEADIPRALRAKLAHEPVLVPTYGWPDGSTVNPATPPDWQWRVEPLIDQRAEAARPEAARPLAIDKQALNDILGSANSPRTIEAYQQLAARHQRTLKTLRHSRQILFRSNFGVLRFERSGGVLNAVHEIYTAVPRLATDVPKPELFVRHVAPLAAPGLTKPQATLQPLKAEAHL